MTAYRRRANGEKKRGRATRREHAAETAGVVVMATDLRRWPFVKGNNLLRIRETEKPLAAARGGWRRGGDFPTNLAALNPSSSKPVVQQRNDQTSARIYILP